MSISVNRIIRSTTSHHKMSLSRRSRMEWIVIFTFVLVVLLLFCFISTPPRRHYKQVNFKNTENEIIKRSEERKARIKASCIKNKEWFRPYLPTRMEFAGCYVSSKLKAIYYPIYKNGHTNILDYLYYLGTPELDNAKNLTRWERIALSNDIERKTSPKSGFKMFRYTPCPNNRGYFKFVFIRDPLQRCVSAWYDRVYKNQHLRSYEPAMVAQITRLGRQNARGLTDKEILASPRPNLTEFFRALLLETGNIAQTFHWKPQIGQVNLCNKEFYFIGEAGAEMSSDIEYITNRLTGQLKGQQMLSDKKLPSTVRQNYVLDVPLDLVRKVVNKLYLQDYALLGYPLPDFDNWKKYVLQNF